MSGFFIAPIKISCKIMIIIYGIKMSNNNEPWLQYPEIWKTKSQYFIWLRGSLRRLWSDYPLRKEWKRRSLRPVTLEERNNRTFHPSTKNVGRCVFCNEWFPGSKLEVDHKSQSEGCYDYETAEKFLWHCAAALDDDMQLACQPCHKIKSYSDRQGISFEEARIEKQAIEFCKRPTQEQIDFLEDIGMYTKNAKQRRKAYTDYLVAKQTHEFFDKMVDTPTSKL